LHRYEPAIVAHRGIHRFDPENSLPAFVEATYHRVDWIECDVWPSADGEVVIVHDETVDRTTTGTGPVGQRRWEELASLQLRNADGSVYGARLPVLRELVQLAARITPPPGLLVEIKPANSPKFVERVIHLLKGACERWWVQSFDEDNLVHALAYDPRAPLAFLVEDRPALERGVANGWKNINADHQLLDEPTVRKMRDAGVTVGAWTVNEEADLRRVMDLGVQWIITDEPVLARKLLQQR